MATADPRTVVVVNSGAPVEMPWADDVDGIVQVWYAGQEGVRQSPMCSSATSTPRAGYLPRFPVRLEDTPAYRFYPGDGQTLHYGEGIFVGYRHYDTKDVAPRFCFGHGLSYTTFAYENLAVARDGTDVRWRSTSPTPARDGEPKWSRCMCAGPIPCGTTGQGAEGVREGVARSRGDDSRAPASSRAAFRHWDKPESRWVVERGEAEILVGASSRDIRLAAMTTL